jgi:hypothetical protein
MTDKTIRAQAPAQQAREARAGVMSDISMPDDRYLAALKRQRQRIADGLEFVAIDSEQIGNKFTHASWGLCSEDKEAWPDAEDHLWPDQFRERGRVAPRYREENQPCPFQIAGTPMGCFYQCRIFTYGTIGHEDRAAALDLYDQRIAAVEGAAPAGPQGQP